MKKRYFILAIVALFGILGNLFLHYKNNQYLHDDIKGKYGVVDYTKSQQSVHYLTSGWKLYLNENKIENVIHKTPDQIIDIYQPLDVDSAIYQLKIINETPASHYAFILPEIFSEYEFYVNGKRIHQQDYIQYTKVTVPGEKILDCYLVTHNQNHYYSGQVFPITFGESSAIDQMQGLQNYSHSAFIVMGILSMVIMGCMYMYTGKEKIYLYGFVFSLLFFVYLSHYFIHQFIGVSTVISYISEDISYYLTLGCLLLFLYQFYIPKQIIKKQWIISATIGIIICCLFSYSFPYQTHLLYYMGLFLKIDILLLLIYVLIRTRDKTGIYYFVLIFVISYIFDFSYDFEPIYLGWGSEIGAVLLLIAYNVNVIQRQISLYRSYHILKDKENFMVEYANTKAHDMKAPMATMKGYIELLQSDLDESDKEHVLNKLNEKISLLSSRLTQLQNLDYETCILTKEKTNLKDLLEDIVKEFDVQLLKKEREIIKELRDVNYSIDPHYFKIIIENLMMNAIEHSYQTKIYVRLFIVENHIHIEIQDFGELIGIEEMNHLFDQGFSTKGSSRGYGLYISKKIIEEHGGELLVVSNQEVGTIFTVSLPL